MHKLIVGCVSLAVASTSRGQDPDFPDKCAAPAPPGVDFAAMPASPAASSGPRVVTLHRADGSPMRWSIVHRTTPAGRSVRLVRDDQGAAGDYESARNDFLALEQRPPKGLRRGLARLVDARLTDQLYRDSPIAIIIRVDIDTIPPAQLDRPIGDDWAAYVADTDAWLTTLEDNAERVLRSTMGDVWWNALRNKAQYGPFLSAVSSAPQVEQLRVAFDQGRIARGMVVAGRTDWRAIEDSAAPSIDESLPTTRTELAHELGADGTGILIGMVEPGIPSEPSGYFAIAGTQELETYAKWHLTAGIALIRNRYPEVTGDAWTGYAPGSKVLLANEGEHENYVKQARWATKNGASVLSMSWHQDVEHEEGDLSERDIFFDWVSAHPPHPTVVASAGNEAESGGFAAGKGYQIISAGNVTNDDVLRRCVGMDPSSSWLNPQPFIESDRELPEIAMPGTQHALLWTSHHGTSAAASALAGVVADIQSVDPELRVWPEAIRAILFASATNQFVDGSILFSEDGRDGVGLVNTQHAALCAKQKVPDDNEVAFYRAHDYGTIDSDEMDDGSFDPERVWEVQTCTTSCRVRVALAWNSDTEKDASLLQADLNLYVISPSGTEWPSVSLDNNYELVEFTPTEVGAYHIEIRDDRMTGGPAPAPYTTRFGIAWTTHYDACP